MRVGVLVVLVAGLAACAGERRKAQPGASAARDDGCGMDVRRLLADELALRPAAAPADLYLLLHEALLGPAPAPADEASLAAELEGLEAAAGEPIVEDLDEVRGTLRLNLRKWRFIRGSAAELLEVIARSGEGPPGDPARLAACSAAAPAALDALGGDGAALETYLRARARESWPLVAHSEKYRKSYQPAYRVVYRRHLPPWVTAPPPATG